MYADSFHRVIEYIYMRGRSNRRIDTMLHILMKVARDMAFERLCKLEKGKVSGCLVVIRRRHMESTKLSTESVMQCNDTQCSVVSSGGTCKYTVLKHKCPLNCHLRCVSCNNCVHSFSCDCMDALVNYTICKHIHLVVSSKQPRETPAYNTLLPSSNDLINETHMTGCSTRKH